MKTAIGKKLGMTQIITDDGSMVAVTLVEAKPCKVTQLKTSEKDGYSAVQLGAFESKKLNKAQKGHLKKSGASSPKLKEFRLEEDPELELGSKVSIDSFEVGDSVKVTGISKGKGFAGTIKRHNFTSGPKTHGSHNIRKPGSIGSVYPQKVWKGKKMAGHMGNKQVTTVGLSIAYLDPAEGIIGIRGAIPGPNRGTVIIVQSNR